MELNKPMLSVLMAAFNCEKYITEAVESVLSQTFIDFELLISDDGSTDGTKAVIDSIADKRVKRLHNDKNIGKSNTINKLFKQARGRFATIHDADDISQYDRFEKQIKFLLENPSYKLCGTNYLWVDQGLKPIQEMKMPESWEEIKQRQPFNHAFHSSSIIFYTSIIDCIGGDLLRPFFQDNNEDCDMAFRMAEKFPACNLQEPLYTYRVNPSSLTNSIRHSGKENMYKVVAHLAMQRKEFGKDDLMLNNESAIVKRFPEVFAKRCSSSSNINELENRVRRWNYLRLYKNSIAACFCYLKEKPKELKAYRLLLFCSKLYILSRKGLKIL